MTEAAGGVVVIGWPQLLLATSFVIFVGVVSLRLSLGLERDLALATGAEPDWEPAPEGAPPPADPPASDGSPAGPAPAAEPAAPDGDPARAGAT